MRKLLDYINKITEKDIDKRQASQLPPLVLAYIGDTVFDLFVRLYLIHTHDASVHNLNNMAISFVKASSQAKALKDIEHLLSDEEKNVVRRGRNAKSGTIPKNADLAEYKMATALEALLGYLFLSGQEDRLYEIMSHIIDENNG